MIVVNVCLVFFLHFFLLLTLHNYPLLWLSGYFCIIASFTGWDLVESRHRSNEKKRQISFQSGCCIVRRETSRILDSRLRGTASSMRHANLVDDWSEYSIRETRRGIRERAQGLPEKTDRPTKHFDCNLARRVKWERSPEDHDYLYHRCACAWRCRKINIY